MIVVSILESDFTTLVAAALPQVPLADAIELRLDFMADVHVEVLRLLVRQIGKPVIAAVNGPDAFGHFRGTRAERFAILDTAARAGAAFVDVDWKEAPFQGPLPSTCRRIVSRHVQDGTPADLERAFTDLEVASRPADRLKFVTHAQSAEDGARLLEFVRGRTRDVIGFASGEKGSFTRVLAPIFGSSFTYAKSAVVFGAPEGGPTAPGQLSVDLLRQVLPARGVTRETAVYAVLGNPARHSLSPRLHNAVFRDAARDAVYVAIEPDDVASFVALCRAPNWRGFSITAPFKEAAWKLAQRADEASGRCGATNTLLCDGSGWNAVNTDVGAAQNALRQGLERSGRAAQTARVVVLGTGGAARAAIVAAQNLHVASITVAGRDASKARTLAHAFAAQSCSIDALATQGFDVLVHCTPVGSKALPHATPIDPRAILPGTVVVEAVYRPARTPLFEAAEARGAIVVPGTEWFLQQALLQAECFNASIWSRETLRAELERALAQEDA